MNDYLSSVDFVKLSNDLKDTENWRQNIQRPDSTRGLNGELRRKLSIDLSFRRSEYIPIEDRLTKEESEEIKIIQKTYDSSAN